MMPHKPLRNQVLLDAPLVPEWNSRTRELFFAQTLVKCFLRPTPVLTAILDAFHESGWPGILHDPLPPQQLLQPQQRLHDAIKRLNRCQKPLVIRFMGDGTGKGIRWTPAKKTRPKKPGQLSGKLP